MNIHEHQAKEILRRYGVATLQGKPAFSVAEAVAAAKELGFPCVVKAQIHAGGRGKAGGVKVCKDEAAVRDIATTLLGKTLVTHQTGPQGRVVKRLFVEQGCEIARELYVGMVVDRGTGRVTLMASTEGGVEIEEVAEKSPDKIMRETVDPLLGLTGFQARRVAFGLGLGSKEQLGKGVKFLQALAKAFVDCDCSMAEINPLVVTKSGDVVALDAKIGFDPNALFRHPDLKELGDPNEQDPRELEAAKFDLSYIALDGNIGCMVNGAGLAMATMDSVKAAGGEPANFLDVGGGANTEKVKAAFKIILSDAAVKAIFINIFGGILRCDVLAEGVVAAAKEVGLAVPLVVRMEGTNVEQGKKILAESGLDIINASDMQDGAEKAVAALKRAS